MGRPGRPRRPSNSTVRTLSDTDIQWFKESNVIKPGSEQDDGSWPDPWLIDAVIYKKDGRTMANALNVAMEGPFIVRGKLRILKKEHLSCLQKLQLKDVHLEIPASWKFSIGFDEPHAEDGPPVPTLWMSSSKGHDCWFKIRPAPEYSPIHHEVLDAVQLYYHVMAAYEEHEEKCKGLKKGYRPKPPTLDEVLFQYALSVGTGTLKHEVYALCRKLHVFLISQFGREDQFSWHNTGFARWLKREYPNVDKQIADAAAKSALDPPPGPPALLAGDDTLPRKSRTLSPRGRPTRNSNRASGSEDIEMSDAPLLLPVKPLAKLHLQAEVVERFKAKTKPPSVTPTPTQPLAADFSTPSSRSSPGPQSTDPPVETLTKLISKIINEVPSVQKVKPSRVQNLIYFKCKIKSYGAPPEILSYYSKELLPRLDPVWKGSVFYEWLANEASKPRRVPENIAVEDIPLQLIRRGTRVVASKSKPMVPTNFSVAGVKDDANSDSDDGRVAGAGKHVRRTAGKAATLRLSGGTGTKRPFSELEDDAPSGGRRGRKSIKRDGMVNNWDDYLEDNDTESDDDSDEPAVAGEKDDDRADGRPPAPPKDAVRIVLHAEAMPNLSPTGPNGTWVCEQEGCGFFVRDAEDEQAVEEIRAHLRDHNDQLDRISLARAEGSRGHAPIDHLLEKLQAAGKKALLAERPAAASGNGEGTRTRIKRQLLV